MAGAPTTPAHLFPADPNNPLVKQALAFNHLTQVPANWVMDSSGQLRLRDPEGTAGPLVPIDQPHLSSFLDELKHALPYIGAAELMGVAGAYIGGTSALPSGLSGAAGGVEAGATSGLGSVALPGAGTALGGAGLGGVEAGATAGLGAAALPGAGTALGGAKSAWDGTIDPSNISDTGSGGFSNLSPGMQALLKGLVGAGGAIGGHLLSQNAAQNAVPPQLTQLLNIGTNRAQYQNPLFQAMNQGVYQMLPDFAKTGNPGLTGSLPGLTGTGS